MNKKNLIIILLIMLLIMCAIIITIIFNIYNAKEENFDKQLEAPMLYTENEVTRVTGKNIFFTLETILNNNSNEGEKIYIQDIYTQDIEIDVQSQFYIYAKIWENNYPNNKTAYIVMNLNREKLLYTIDVQKQNITKQEYEKIIEELENQENNNLQGISYEEGNTFKFENVGDDQIVKRNIEYYRALALYAPNEAYNIINEEYKEKRFGGIQKYYQYLDEYKQTIENMNLIKYSSKYQDNKKIYIAIDNFDNYYIIEGDTFFDFKIQLDNYTIEDGEYISKYMSLSEENKAQICASKIIKMINTKDYENLYNLMDETYRNNNFKTIEQFKNFINEKYYFYNIIDTLNTELNVNSYICEFNIRSGNTASALETKNKIIVQIGENTDFKISFVK